MLFYKKTFYKQHQAAGFSLVGGGLGGIPPPRKKLACFHYFAPKMLILQFYCSFLDILPKLFTHKSIPFGKPWGWDLIQTNKYQK